MERQLRVRLPVEISFFTCVFLFASYVLGETKGFYERVWWWDLGLHASSALVFGLIGFLVVYVRHGDKLLGRNAIRALLERSRRA